MKFRLAKKIMKQARHLSTASDYWYRRLRDFEYKICYGFVGKKDHRITKAISLTSKKRKMRIKDTDTFVDLSKEDKDALDTWAHYCKQHEGYERNEEGN
nr:MAG: hypothetical protein [Bacteriophage sp.]